MKLYQINENKIEINQETINYLFDIKQRGATITNIRKLIANLYNHSHYPAPNLFKLMRNADDDHTELILNLIEFCSPQHGDSCFFLINELAPKLIDRFRL